MSIQWAAKIIVGLFASTHVTKFQSNERDMKFYKNCVYSDWNVEKENYYNTLPFTIH